MIITVRALRSAVFGVGERIAQARRTGDVRVGVLVAGYPPATIFRCPGFGP